MLSVNPQYITDEKGNKISVVLPINEYISIMEDLEELEDIKLYDESKNDNEPAIIDNEAMLMIEKERSRL